MVNKLSDMNITSSMFYIDDLFLAGQHTQFFTLGIAWLISVYFSSDCWVVHKLFHNDY